MLVSTITGTVGRDPERQDKGTWVTIRFSVAVQVGWGDKKKTVWHNLSIGETKRGKWLLENVRKGQNITVVVGVTNMTAKEDSISVYGDVLDFNVLPYARGEKLYGDADVVDTDEIPF